MYRTMLVVVKFLHSMINDDIYMRQQNIFPDT